MQTIQTQTSITNTRCDSCDTDLIDFVHITPPTTPFRHFWSLLGRKSQTPPQTSSVHVGVFGDDPHDHSSLHGLHRGHKKHKVQLNQLKQFMCFLQSHSGSSHYKVNLWLASPTDSAQLNQTHRNQHDSTDVLSFPQLDTSPDNLFQPSFDEDDGGHLGEIVICIQKIKEYAQISRLDHHGYAALEQALLGTITHGFLHLLGYDHATDEQYEQMESIQHQYLQIWNQRPIEPCIWFDSKFGSFCS